jgi:plastocyanin
MRFCRMSAGIVLAAATLALGACGGDDESESSSTPESTPTEAATKASGGTLAIAAPSDGSLKFTKSSWTADAGKVKIDFDNPSTVPHAVEIEGNGVEKETKTVTEAKADVTVDLKPGTYEIYCPVGNHRQAGMEGTLTVK